MCGVIPNLPAEPVDVLVRLLGELDAEPQPNLVPQYAHPGDAGADLRAAIDITIPPLGRAVVPTGIAIALPNGYAAFVHPRSGLAAKAGVTVLNAPGTIDAGYRGEIKVILHNTDPQRPVVLATGDRIAQLVVQPVMHARFLVASRLPGAARGTNGFGSTGGIAGVTDGHTMGRGRDGQ